jgi:phenylacetate-CoA ligase (EC 6.2.1.30)
MDIQYWEPHIELAPKKEIEEIQRKRLKFILNYVYERSPFYKRKFKEANVSPHDFYDLKDIRKFPFTTKSDLLENSYPYGGDFLCVPREEIIGWHMSSGTTGRPTIGAYTFKDHETWMNLMARTLVTAGVKKGDIILNIYGYGLFTGGLGFHQSSHLVGASVIPWGVGRTEAMVDIIKNFKPTVMTGTPSYQLYILEFLNKRGIDPRETSIRITMPGAEMWTEQMRKRIEEGFGLKEKGGGARNIYGATELLGPGSGQECIYENGFHFWVDHFFLEIIDPETLEPVNPGEEGEMVVTTLTKEAMPLIRYRMRDITVLDVDKCPCGRNAFPRCMQIKGRVDDVIHYKGAKVWPSDIQRVILKYPEVIEYQVIVDKPAGEFVIKIELKENLGEDVKSKIREEIRYELERNLIFVIPKVQIVEQGSLPRYEGKSKRIIIKEF